MARAMLCLGKKPFRRYRNILFTKDYPLSTGELSKRRARHVHIVWYFDRESLICECAYVLVRFFTIQKYGSVVLYDVCGWRKKRKRAGKWRKTLRESVWRKMGKVRRDSNPRNQPLRSTKMSLVRVKIFECHYFARWGCFFTGNFQARCFVKSLE